MITETKIVNISSQSATYIKNGSMKSDLIFFIPNFILRNEAIQNIYFSVLSSEVPNSFYLINQYNNIISIYQNSITTNYSIPYGNYNITTLITALQTLLTGFTITYNSTTLKLTLSHPTAYFYVITASSTCQRILGLDESTDLQSAYLNSVYTTTTPYVINLLPQQKIHFRSSNLLLDNYNTYDGSTDIFLSLQNNSNLGQGIYYTNNNINNRFLLDLDHLQQLDIRITDDKNRLLDFNNCNWYLTLKIDYELKERIPKMTIEQFLKDNKIPFDEKYLENLRINEFNKII